MSLGLSDNDIFAILTGNDQSENQTVSPDVPSSGSQEPVEGTPQEQPVAPMPEQHMEQQQPQEEVEQEQSQPEEQPIQEQEQEQEPVEEQQEEVQEEQQDATIVGKTIQDVTISSVDEAEQLIAHGINATNAYKALAPYKQVIAVLDENNFTDPNKLLMAIDIQNGDIDAIKKLITDLNIDVDKLYSEEDERVSYTPKAKVLSEEALYMKEVVNTHAKGNEALAYIQTWDRFSTDEVVKHPGILKDVADHMQSGLYDEISKIMRKEEYMGGLNSTKSTIERYKDAMLVAETNIEKQKKEAQEQQQAKVKAQTRNRSGSPKAAPQPRQSGSFRPTVQELNRMGSMGESNVSSLIDSLYINKK